MKKGELNEEFFVNLMIIIISILFYILAVNSLLSLLFWPKEALAWYDYILEIVAYVVLGSILLIKRGSILKRLV